MIVSFQSDHTREMLRVSTKLTEQRFKVYSSRLTPPGGNWATV